MKGSDGLAGLRKRPVLLEEFGVYVKPLTVGQTADFAKWRKANPDSMDVVALLVSLSLCDADGGMLLASPQDAHDLDMKLCEALCERIIELNGLTEKPDPKADSSVTPA
jgi:hypothetical protein